MSTLAAIAALIMSVGSPSPGWETSCRGIDDAWPLACEDRHDNAFDVGRCEAAQRDLRRKSHFRLLHVRTAVRYDAARKRFEVGVLPILVKTVRVDCERAPCRSRLVTMRTLGLTGDEKLRPRLRAIDAGIDRLDNPFTRFYVPVDEVKSPKRFEEDLHVDVIVRVARDDVVRTPDLTAETLIVAVVGIRARLAGSSWSEEERRPPSTIACERPKAPAAVAAGPEPDEQPPKEVEPERPKPREPEPARSKGDAPGLNKAAIEATIDHHAARIRLCYSKAAYDDPGLSGGFTFQWQIRPDGSVSGLRELRRTMDSDDVARCLRATIASMRFPKFEGPPLDVVFPFEFGD